MPRETADAPIGIFDSGFGGLTVARAVIDQLPHESVVYLGDTARQPYGQKPIGEVREYALECLDHLVRAGREGAGHRVQLRQRRDAARCARALRRPRRRGDPPRGPARRAAATRNRRIGVICTRATASSLAYDDAFAAAPHLDAAHPGLPALRGVRRAGRHRRRRAAGRRPRLPRPAGRGRGRHPDPRLHPLPAADRRHLLRDGRRGHPGQLGGGVRQGRLQDARRHRH